MIDFNVKIEVKTEAELQDVKMESKPPDIAKELMQLYFSLRPKGKLLKVTKANIKYCEQLVEYAHNLLDVPRDLRAKWSKLVRYRWQLCQSCIEGLSIRILKFHAAPLPNKSEPTRKELDELIQDFDKHQAVTEENVNACEHLVKFGRELTTISLEADNLIGSGKYRKLKACTQMIAELAKKVEKFKAKQRHQKLHEGHEHSDTRLCTIRVKGEPCDEQPLEPECRPVKEEPFDEQPTKMKRRPIKEEPRDEKPLEEEPLPKKHRVELKDEPM